MHAPFKPRKYRHGLDQASVIDLYARISAQDASIGAISIDDWKRFIQLPQNKQGRDFRLAIFDDRVVVGIAMSSLRDNPQQQLRHFRILVEPGYRRQGIGSMLLREVGTIDPGTAGWLQTLCPAEWAAATAFYDHLRFTIADQELEMALKPDSKQVFAQRGAWDTRREMLSERLASVLARIHNDAYEGSHSFVRVNAQTFPDLVSGWNLATAHAIPNAA